MQCGRYSCQIKKKLYRFSKNHQIWKFMKIRPVGPDGRTDLTKLRVAHRSFWNAPENRPGRCDTSDVLTRLIVKICRFGTKVSEQLLALPTRRRTEISRPDGTHIPHYTTTHRNLSTRRYPHTALHDVASRRDLLRFSSLSASRPTLQEPQNE